MAWCATVLHDSNSCRIHHRSGRNAIFIVASMWNVFVVRVVLSVALVIWLMVFLPWELDVLPLSVSGVVKSQIVSNAGINCRQSTSEKALLVSAGSCLMGVIDVN